MGRQKVCLEKLCRFFHIRNQLLRQALAECLGTLILVVSECVCARVRVCRERDEFGEKHTHDPNYTPTYFNPVPAFIRLFDKLGNYNNKITLRP